MGRKLIEFDDHRIPNPFPGEDPADLQDVDVGPDTRHNLATVTSLNQFREETGIDPGIWSDALHEPYPVNGALSPKVLLGNAAMWGAVFFSVRKLKRYISDGTL